MSLVSTLELLRSTRILTVVVVVLLSVQLSGNLYEELVSNVATYADPAPGSLGEFDAGSPLFFYLPWVPTGLALAVVLVVRLHRLAPAYVVRRARWALAALGVAVVAKAVLIARVNPEFRRVDIPLDEIRSAAIVWGSATGSRSSRSRWPWCSSCRGGPASSTRRTLLRDWRCERGRRGTRQPG